MTTKHDEGKWRFSLIPWSALKEIIMVMEYGAKNIPLITGAQSPTQKRDISMRAFATLPHGGMARRMMQKVDLATWRTPVAASCFYSGLMEKKNETD